MIDFREIDSIKKAPERARDLARFLLKLDNVGWTEWELDFLEGMAEGREEISTRQAEKVLELRDATQWYETAEGFSLARLVEACQLDADLLSEHDQEFIARLKSTAAKKIRRREANRLLRCARTVGAIEPHQGRSLDRSDAHP